MASFGLNRLPWYGQIGAFAGLALAGVAVFWTYFAQPAQAHIDEQQAQLASVRAEIDRGMATARRLPEYRKEIASLELQLERLRAVLPEEQDVADLLRRVQGMATQSNLTIRGFTPKAVARKQLHMEWPIGLQLEGTYHDLGDFLERVSKFPRIINVGNLIIRAKETPTGSGTITAECTATTFVLLDNAAAAAPGTTTAAAAAAPRTE